ncbi:MAG: RNA pseudouridine synthase [Treponema sp.]|jgi:23S rRNA pseudouridine1911/1915/1917 synthase|nr:RNA pseudouridine synthase [Treponema sp.]
MTDEISGRILYCDGDCVVVNKAAGEAVEGAGKGMIDLPKLLAAQMSGLNLPPALPEEDALALPTAVHRLDVPVSGCAAFARTGTALRFLNNVFRGGMAEKRYWAIVEPPKDSGACQWIEEPSSEFVEIVHWIQFDSRKNKSFAHNERGQRRKKAIIRCRLAGRGKDYLFLEIDLVTGRHHQIRAQFEKLGLHIKGDLKYGARRSDRDGGIRLHARLLSFPRAADSGSSPAGIRRITAQADPPIQDNLWQAFRLAVTEPLRTIDKFPKTNNN